MSVVREKIRDAKFQISFIQNRIDRVINMTESKIVKAELEAIKALLGGVG